MDVVPYGFWNPVGNGGGYEADDRDAYATAVQYGVGLEIGLPGVNVDGVGTEDGIVAVADVFVEYGVTSFKVMIADDGNVVTNKITEVSYAVTFALADEIEIIRSGFALQHIATVNQNRAARSALAFLGDIGIDSL